MCESYLLVLFFALKLYMMNLCLELNYCLKFEFMQFMNFVYVLKKNMNIVFLSIDQIHNRIDS